MIAVDLTLGVVYPHMTGACSDAFRLIQDAATGTQHVDGAAAAGEDLQSGRRCQPLRRRYRAVAR